MNLDTFVRRVLSSVAVISLCALSSNVAFAAGAGGYRIYAADATALGMGAAFTGQADNPSAVYYNPAGMTQIVGQAVSMNVSVIEPHETYKGNQSANAVQMKRGDFPIPSLFYVTRLGTEKFALGLGTTTMWGLTTEWAGDSFARYNATRTALTNHDYLASLAYKVNEQWSLAVGLDVDQSLLDQQKKVDPVNAGGGADVNMRMVARDTAAGFRLATMYKIDEKNQVGLMYRSAIHHEYTGKIHLDGLNPTLTSIFGGSSYETDVSMKSTIPQSVVLGYSFKPTSKWILNADVEWTDWSAIERIDPQYTSETNATRLNILRQGYPISKDWHSSLGVAGGAQYSVTDRLRIRGGSYFNQSPIPNDSWDPSIPDANNIGVCAGFGFDLTKNTVFDFGWTTIFYLPRKVNNDVADGMTGTHQIDGEYRQWMNMAHVSVTYKF